MYLINRLLKIYNKIDEAQDYLSHFANTEWTFVNDNLLALWDTIDDQDKKLFNFDVNQISWDYFLKAHCLGLRVYLVKDDIYSLPDARKKWKRYGKYLSKTFYEDFLIERR